MSNADSANIADNRPGARSPGVDILRWRAAYRGTGRMKKPG
jgi:hypothetical protein